jgi:carlactone synthase/all-trans-10'-apo-beta-carotenal 13,14-cleaving dioxygenase
MPTDACRATLVGDALEVPGPQTLPSSAIEGTLPNWLKGALVANGGGEYGGMLHLFDGLASVARVGLNEGPSSSNSATFAQRMVRTRAYERKQQTGKVAYREFATAPPVEPPGLVGEARALFSQLAQLASGKPEFTDNASVNLIPVSLPSSDVDDSNKTKNKNLLLAVSETPGASYLVDSATLETVASAAPDATGATDGVPGMLTTAHPARLRGGKELVNFTRTLPFGGMHVYRMDTQGPEALRRRPVAFLPDRRAMSPTWVHDFVATEDYAVIVEPPIYMNLASLMLGGDRQPKKGVVPGASDFVFMDWKPEDGVRVALVPLKKHKGGDGGDDGKAGGASDGSSNTASTKKKGDKAAAEQPRYFLIPKAFFVFHFGNAFVSKDERTGAPIFCVDLAAYDDPAILNDLRLAPLRAGGQPLGDRREGHGPGGRTGEVSKSRYVRLTIPLDPKLGSMSPSAPAPLASPVPLTKEGEADTDFCEFPCVNPKFKGRSDSRYAYVMNAVRPTNMGNALAKLDLLTGESKTWREPGGAPGEPVFVPRPGAEAEDDGAVLAFVAAPEGGSFVVVLDAREWKEVARVRLPAGVPYRFHGGFLPAAADE